MLGIRLLYSFPIQSHHTYIGKLQESNSCGESKKRKKRSFYLFSRRRSFAHHHKQKFILGIYIDTSGLIHVERWWNLQLILWFHHNGKYSCSQGKNIHLLLFFMVRWNKPHHHSYQENTTFPFPVLFPVLWCYSGRSWWWWRGRWWWGWCSCQKMNQFGHTYFLSLFPGNNSL